MEMSLPVILIFSLNAVLLGVLIYCVRIYIKRYRLSKTPENNEVIFPPKLPFDKNKALSAFKD